MTLLVRQRGESLSSTIPKKQARQLSLESEFVGLNSYSYRSRDCEPQYRRVRGYRETIQGQLH